MNVKSKKAKKQVNVKNSVINVLSTEEINKKVEAIKKELKASTWRELEANGKFAKNDKQSQVTQCLSSHRGG